MFGAQDPALRVEGLLKEPLRLFVVIEIGVDRRQVVHRCQGAGVILTLQRRLDLDDLFGQR